MTAVAPEAAAPIEADPDAAVLAKAAEEKTVKFWKQRIESAANLECYKNHKKSKTEAKNFYNGNQIPEADWAAWDGDAVKANLFKRLVNFMCEASYAQNPKIRVLPRKGNYKPKSPMQGAMPTNMGMEMPGMEQPETETLTSAQSIEIHLKYLFEECKIDDEIKRDWKDSYFGNLAAVKLDFDRSRGLWRVKWVAGTVICDPDAHGDLSRARWVAECVQLPRYRIWQDPTFDKAARLKIREQQKVSETSLQYHGNMASPGNTEADIKANNNDTENVWYIYTKESLDPLNYDPDNPIESRIQLAVIAENYEGFLLKTDNPCPYLDEDQFPYSILRLDEVPGEYVTPPLWEQVKAICQAFNWAASYHMSDMRKTASRPIGYDKDAIEDPAILNSRKHMVPIPINTLKGAKPADCVFPLNIGAADKTIFDSTNFFYQLLDQVTGVDEIARGEEGRTKTATESQILQQNSSIALRGIGRALDKFIGDLVCKLGLVTLYYTPAFSIVDSGMIDPMTMQPMMMTKMVGEMPQIDMMTGMPAVDMMTGMPVMQKQVMDVPAPPGSVPTKGIDFFHGEDVAMVWPGADGNFDFNTIKSEVGFSIEAGSTKAEQRQEKKRTALELFQTVALEYKEMGLFEQYFECLSMLINAFDSDNIDKLLPPKQQVVQNGQQSMMRQMMIDMETAKNGGAGKPGGGKPGKKKSGLDPAKNEGKDFPHNG